MRRTALAFCLILFTACSGPAKNAGSRITFADNVVVAHRGAFKKNGFPENSVAALREAIRLQCTGSEFDVRMTADDSLIINHDPHYAKLEIEKTGFAQLRGTRLSNGELLPTLREYLLAGLSNNPLTRLVLEIKPSATKERGMNIVAKVVALVQALGAEPKIVYISFDYDMVKKLVSLSPHVPVQYLNGDKSPEELAADGISGADYHFSVFKKNTGWIEEARTKKIVLNAWTVNDTATMDWLLSEKFDFITTNEPELLLTRIAVSRR